MNHLCTSVLALVTAIVLIFYGCAGEDREQQSTGERAAARATLTEEEAITIAEPHLRERFPKFDECHPYRAQLRRGVWHVHGTLPEGTIGGTPEALVRDSDGAVIEIYHTQ